MARNPDERLIVQIINNRVFWITDMKTLDQAMEIYPPDVLFVDAPGYVTTEWGYDPSKEGDERFTEPVAPEGFYFDREANVMRPNEMKEVLRKAEYTKKQDENKAKLAAWLDANPIEWKDGKKYGIDFDSQSEISLNLQQYQLQVQIRDNQLKQIENAQKAKADAEQQKTDAQSIWDAATAETERRAGLTEEEAAAEQAKRDEYYASLPQVTPEPAAIGDGSDTIQVEDGGTVEAEATPEVVDATTEIVDPSTTLDPDASVGVNLNGDVVAVDKDGNVINNNAPAPVPEVVVDPDDPYGLKMKNDPFEGLTDPETIIIPEVPEIELIKPVLQWHAIKEACVDWNVEDLTELAAQITTKVYPALNLMNCFKEQIYGFETVEEVRAFNPDYRVLDPSDEPPMPPEWLPGESPEEIAAAEAAKKAEEEAAAAEGSEETSGEE